MAAVSYTQGDYKPGTGAQFTTVTAGSAGLQFDVCYKNGSNYDPADSSSAAKSGIVGMFTTRCDASGLVQMQTAGRFKTVSAVFTEDTWYYVDSVAGQIVPESDLGTGEFVT